MKNTIELTNIKGYEFEGYIPESYLTDNDLNKLNLIRGSQDDDVEVIGEFEVVFKNKEISHVRTLSLHAIGTKRLALHDAPTYYSVPLDITSYDTDKLSEEILEFHDNTRFYEDRAHYLESLNERQD